MIEYKQSQNARVIVRLLDATGVPVTGVASGSAAATVEKSDGSTVAVVLSGANWIEITGGVFSGLGVYNLIIPASATDLTGILNYAASGPGAVTYVGTAKVVANEEVDTFSRVGSPIGASISADIVQVPIKAWNELTSSHQGAGSVGRMLNDAFRLLQNQAIINPTSKQLEVYNDARDTIIFRFDLKDDVGVASATKIFQRIPNP